LSALGAIEKPASDNRSMMHFAIVFASSGSMTCRFWHSQMAEAINELT
jgi:hypothetical protein